MVYFALLIMYGVFTFLRLALVLAPSLRKTIVVQIVSVCLVRMLVLSSEPPEQTNIKFISLGKCLVLSIIVRREEQVI